MNKFYISIKLNEVQKDEYATALKTFEVPKIRNCQLYQQTNDIDRM